jgi:hypothetical protein
MLSPNPAFDLASLARLPARDRQLQLLAIAARMVPTPVTDDELEGIEDVMFLLGELIRERLEDRAAPNRRTFQPAMPAE